jgi:hypothetical protein
LRRKTTSGGFYVKQDGVGLDQLARARERVRDAPGAPGADCVLHLHAFDYCEHSAAFDDIACLDTHFDDATRKG